jgi:HK97 family phage portal protein
VYEINGDEYAPDDIVHIKIGVTLPGDPWCLGVVEAFRRGLGGMLAQQGMANSVFEHGAVPSVHLQVDVPNLGTDQASIVRTNWEGAHAGRRGTGVTGKNVSVTPLSWSADDAQFLETQQFSVAQAALMFGLRPEDLGATVGGSSLTYGNRTDDAIQRITDAYVPVMMPIEQAWSRLIPGRNFVKGNAEALLRSTTRERYEVHALAQQIGVETRDETREIEGKPKLDPEPEPPAVEPVSADATTDDQEEGGDAA